MEVFRNQQEVRTERHLALPSPICRGEVKYRHQESTSMNQIRIQKNNPVLTQLQLNMMPLNVTRDPLAVTSNVQSIEEHFRKNS